MLLGCQAAEPASTQSSAWPSDAVRKIVDGEREVGRDAVVFVQSPRGSCSGALIGERVVLTAKHCVQSAGAAGPFPAADINVGVGSDVMSADMEFFPVTDVVTAPGIYYDSEDEGVKDLLPNDLALLTLQYSPGIKPLSLSFAKPSLFAGVWTTAVGFGYTPGNFVAGTKMSVRTRLNSVDDLALYVSRTVCPGDSGGPLINDEQVIVGVVSLGTGEVCGAGLGLYNPIHLHRDLIVEVLASAGGIPGTCVASGVEICDGRDNDCDGAVDEGCLQLGDACGSDFDCAGSRCEETSAGRVCTQSCDALSPGNSCPAGLRCEGQGSCRGVCVPGGPGVKMHGEDCVDDTECASLLCADAGNGRMACASPCRGDADTCFGGEACSAQPGACGGCVQAQLKAGGLRFGEPCEAPDRCRSGLCLEDSGLSYCSESCELNDDCVEGAHCRDGACVRGAPSGLGGTCVATDDCAKEMFCSISGGEGFCARYCVDSVDCGSGFTCERTRTGSACMPERRVLGSACVLDAECASDLCDAESGHCSLPCTQNAMCGSGFECVRRDPSQLSGLCLLGGPLAVSEEAPGGCRTGRGQGAGLGLYLLGAMFGLVWWRRRIAG